MAYAKDLLKNLKIFSALTDSEVDQILKSSKEVKYEEGETIFTEGDESGMLYLILEGAVQISTLVMEDLEKPLVTLRDGKVFGEVSLVDKAPRESRAKAVENSILLALEANDFEKLVEETPSLGVKILSVLTRTVVDRIRLTTEQYRSNVRWGLDVSGALKLNWQRLITDEVRVSLELVNGSRVEGSFLKVDENKTGYELFLKSDKGSISIVPYHAVMSISFERFDVISKERRGETA